MTNGVRRIIALLFLGTIILAKVNGNGSLMRILPILFYLHSRYGTEINEPAFEVSSLTHAHKRSLIACGIRCRSCPWACGARVLANVLHM